MGFEQLARRFGVQKARRIFDAYREKLRIDNHKATQQEIAAAAARARRGPVVVRNDFDFAPAYHITPLTYKQLHRSTLGQRGCKGGEVFDDDEAMRDFLKRHPECAPQKMVTGDIRSGWTSALDRAAKEGRMHRALEMAKVSLTLKQAAQEGSRAIVA
jgi:hypothetical protein